MSRRIFVVGSANMDLVLRVPRFPLAGETLTGSDLQLVPGGKGANQACAAARLGGEVYFVGCTGDDTFGSQLLLSLRDAGVKVERMRTSPRATGCASIYVQPNGQNSIVISPGANADLQSGQVREALHDLRRDDIVLLQLEIPFETVQLTLEIGKAAGATTILDPAPASPLGRDTLQLVDIVTPNETEAAILFGLEKDAQGQDDREPGRLGCKALALGARSVIFKLGEAGCAIVSRELAAKLDAYPVKATDTTAAGDVFNGALAVALSESRSLIAAAQFANAAAALSVTRSGAQTSVPARADTDKFITENRPIQVRDISILR